MKNKKTVLLLLLAFFIFSSFTFVGPGDKVPDIKLIRSDGKIVSLRSFKGKVVLINFWATWCPPCVHEMPYLNALYQKLHSKGLEIVAVANPRDSIDRVKAFFRYNNIQFDYYLDADFSAARAFGVRALPTTFVVDRKGVIRNKFIGARPWTSEEFIDYFRSLLKEGKKK